MSSKLPKYSIGKNFRIFKTDDEKTYYSPVTSQKLSEHGVVDTCNLQDANGNKVNQLYPIEGDHSTPLRYKAGDYTKQMYVPEVSVDAVCDTNGTAYILSKPTNKSFSYVENTPTKVGEIDLLSSRFVDNKTIDAILYNNLSDISANLSCDAYSSYLDVREQVVLLMDYFNSSYFAAISNAINFSDFSDEALNMTYDSYREYLAEISYQSFYSEPDEYAMMIISAYLDTLDDPSVNHSMFWTKTLNDLRAYFNSTINTIVNVDNMNEVFLSNDIYTTRAISSAIAAEDNSMVLEDEYESEINQDDIILNFEQMADSVQNQSSSRSYYHLGCLSATKSLTADQTNTTLQKAIWTANHAIFDNFGAIQRGSSYLNAISAFIDPNYTSMANFNGTGGGALNNSSKDIYDLSVQVMQRKGQSILVGYTDDTMAFTNKLTAAAQTQPVAYTYDCTWDQQFTNMSSYGSLNALSTTTEYADYYKTAYQNLTVDQTLSIDSDLSHALSSARLYIDYSSLSCLSVTTVQAACITSYTYIIQLPGYQTLDVQGAALGSFSKNDPYTALTTFKVRLPKKDLSDRFIFQDADSESPSVVIGVTNDVTEQDFTDQLAPKSIEVQAKYYVALEAKASCDAIVTKKVNYNQKSVDPFNSWDALKPLKYPDGVDWTSIGLTATGLSNEYYDLTRTHSMDKNNCWIEEFTDPHPTMRWHIADGSVSSINTQMVITGTAPNLAMAYNTNTNAARMQDYTQRVSDMMTSKADNLLTVDTNFAYINNIIDESLVQFYNQPAIKQTVFNNITSLYKSNLVDYLHLAVDEDSDVISSQPSSKRKTISRTLADEDNTPKFTKVTTTETTLDEANGELTIKLFGYKSETKDINDAENKHTLSLDLDRGDSEELKSGSIQYLKNESSNLTAIQLNTNVRHDVSETKIDYVKPLELEVIYSDEVTLTNDLTSYSTISDLIENKYVPFAYSGSKTSTSEYTTKIQLSTSVIDEPSEAFSSEYLKLLIGDTATIDNTTVRIPITRYASSDESRISSSFATFDTTDVIKADEILSIWLDPDEEQNPVIDTSDSQYDQFFAEYCVSCQTTQSFNGALKADGYANVFLSEFTKDNSTLKEDSVTASLVDDETTKCIKVKFTLIKDSTEYTFTHTIGNAYLRCEWQSDSDDNETPIISITPSIKLDEKKISVQFSGWMNLYDESGNTLAIALEKSVVTQAPYVEDVEKPSWNDALKIEFIAVSDPKKAKISLGYYYTAFKVDSTYSEFAYQSAIPETVSVALPDNKCIDGNILTGVSVEYAVSCLGSVKDSSRYEVSAVTSACYSTKIKDGMKIQYAEKTYSTGRKYLTFQTITDPGDEVTATIESTGFDGAIPSTITPKTSLKGSQVVVDVSYKDAGDPDKLLDLESGFRNNEKLGYFYSTLSSQYANLMNSDSDVASNIDKLQSKVFEDYFNQLAHVWVSATNGYQLTKADVDEDVTTSTISSYIETASLLDYRQSKTIIEMMQKSFSDFLEKFNNDLSIEYQIHLLSSTLDYYNQFGYDDQESTAAGYPLTSFTDILTKNYSQVSSQIYDQLKSSIVANATNIALSGIVQAMKNFALALSSNYEFFSYINNTSAYTDEEFNQIFSSNEVLTSDGVDYTGYLPWPAGNNAKYQYYSKIAWNQGNLYNGYKLVNDYTHAYDIEYLYYFKNNLRTFFLQTAETPATTAAIQYLNSSIIDQVASVFTREYVNNQTVQKAVFKQLFNIFISAYLKTKTELTYGRGEFDILFKQNVVDRLANFSVDLGLSTIRQSLADQIYKNLKTLQDKYYQGVRDAICKACFTGAKLDEIPKFDVNDEVLNDDDLVRDAQNYIDMAFFSDRYDDIVSSDLAEKNNAILTSDDDLNSRVNSRVNTMIKTAMTDAVSAINLNSPDDELKNIVELGLRRSYTSYDYSLSNAITQFGVNRISASLDAIDTKISSAYADYLDGFIKANIDDLSVTRQAFAMINPKCIISNANYNYILEVPLNQNSNPTEGYIETNPVISKSLYNPDYTLDYNSDKKLISCARQYDKIGTCGNTVFLTYSEVNLGGDLISNAVEVDNNLCADILDINQTTAANHHLNVEVIKAMTTQQQTAALHKTGAYDINVKNLPIVSAENPDQVDLVKAKLKMKIKQIVKQMMPLNTQLININLD